jgi:hypothetical protein
MKVVSVIKHFKISMSLLGECGNWKTSRKRMKRMERKGN